MNRSAWLVVLALAVSVPVTWWLGPGRRAAPAASRPSVSNAEPPAHDAKAPVAAELVPKVAARVMVMVAVDSRVDHQPLVREAFDLRERFGDEVAVVVRVAPPASDLAASLAHLAAERQGRGREYLDALLEAGGLDDATVVAHAKSLGLDIERFDRDRRDPLTRDEVERARSTLRALGVTAPGVLINARAASSGSSIGGLAGIVEAELAEAKALIGRGAPVELLHEARARSNAGPLFQTYWQGLINPAPVATDAPQREAEPAVPASALFDTAIWHAEVHGREPAKGNPQALVTIVEFGDFTCAWCGRAAEVIDQLLDRHPGELRVVWKTLVLPTHERSRAAAETALAAHDHSKFWTMQERLFGSPTKLSDEDFAHHGEELGIGSQAILRAIRTRSHEKIIRADQELARKLGIRSAPNFFFNGRLVTGFREIDELELLVAEELKKARAMVAKGVAASEVYAHIMRQANASEPLSEKVNTFTHQGRPARGAKDGDIVITEFVDYQFYPSLAWNEMARALVADRRFAGRVRVVVKQLPHVAHPLGREAALAVLAADEQGKFWEMHEKLLALHGDLKPWTCEAVAHLVGLDMERYTTSIREGRGKAQLEQDVLEGRAAGKISGPALFLGGRRIEDEDKLTEEKLVRLVARYFGRSK